MDPQETAGIEYRVPAEIPPDEAAELYLEAGWMDHADTAAVSAMLQGTFAVSAAFHNGRLIGFMRAFSDGVSDATCSIWWCGRNTANTVSDGRFWNSSRIT